MPIEKGSCYVVAEIGINHNGDLQKALKLIDAAVAAGCDAVKFQKRTVDVVYTPEELATPRKSVFGDTNGDLKRGLEFGKEEYDRLYNHCNWNGMDLFASPWDEASVDFLAEYKPPYLKVASASITDADLLVHMAETKIPLLVSTGMCDIDMIKRAVELIDLHDGTIACLYHCTSTYPTKPWEVNLKGIRTLKEHFLGIPIGFSGHSEGPVSGTMAAVLGAVSVERHITLNRADWGSDQSASLEKKGMQVMVSQIRLFEVMRGDGIICIYDSERPIIDKLRRKDTL